MAQQLSDYRDILVVCDTRGDQLSRTSLEILTKAREIGDGLGARVEAVILGQQVEGLAETAIHNGADVVHLAQHEALVTGNIDAYYAVVLPLIKERKPEIVLMSATPLGLDLAPRLGAALGTGALSDATKLDVDENDRLLVAKRLTYDGSVEAAATIPRHRPQIASLRPGAVRPGFPDDSRYGRVENVEVDIPKSALKVQFLGMEEAPVAEPALEEAEVVVAGGLGFGKEEFPLVQQLAQALGGTWGASRAAVQFGHAPDERQVGATGAHVAPKLYIAAGVSGQFDHFYGVRKAETIVGINVDKKAPIFRYAQYGLVGDAKEIIPKILEYLRKE
ncbi:MAG TPA: electron transfer flavoprotein subunit alpha/FixB family protein [Candidatus Thermoplasmatota archaeon]|nr:electron transfer flavoprotein subunit alpha/FixB family protein [Candidatus Thermoplasmatota archaeon]